VDKEVEDMPTWVWLIIATVVVVVAVVIIAVSRSASRRSRTERLKQHYGGEYERQLEETGDQRAAESALLAREKKVKKLDIVKLSPRAHAMYDDQWRRVQTAFVDNPSGAVGDADLLVNQVMRERGYPVDDFEENAADISVDHPEVVENYRAAHGIFVAQNAGHPDTERQREAFVHYRALFEKLLESETDNAKEARA
jgi:hypothetical protein